LKYSSRVILISLALKSPFLWDVVLHQWVNDILRQLSGLILTRIESFYKIRSLGCLKMLGTDYPLMWCHISEDWRPWIHYCKSLKNLHIMAFIAIFIHYVSVCTL